MSSFSSFVLQLLSYSDSSSNNNPQKRDFDVAYQWTDTLTRPSQQDLSLAVGDNTITIPSGTKWLAVLTDQALKVKMDGAAELLTPIAPSAAGTQDGIMFIRVGSINSLVLHNDGAAAANVKVFTAK